MKSSKPIQNLLSNLDPLLIPYNKDIDLRINRYLETLMRLKGKSPDDTLAGFSDGFFRFGFHRTETGWKFAEWLPNADEVHLMGDFNHWNHESHPLSKSEDGVWTISLEGKNALSHRQYIKLWIRKGSQWFERLPAYTMYASMDEHTHKLCSQIWSPENAFEWTDCSFSAPQDQSPLIYECHIGMAQESYGIGSYREFADRNLERIASLGYNTIQLMAIQEHPYYASFGYQVSGFFAASSRYGEPDDLKYLINKAHHFGLSVLLDIVHSHSCVNLGESLYLQDGSDNQYFIPGEEGWHPAWKTKLFQYSKDEVLNFLLSNLRFWLEEYHFDGFRFDGVTSMIFRNHGLGTAFVDYGQYFSLNSDIDGQVYLMLANELIREIKPDAITIAEDMSGMPGMCIPVCSGGFGFQYRLGMGLPDYWIRVIKDISFVNMDMFQLWNELTTRRPQEKVIGYCESHDQALVGDKTLIFRMADADMYTGMRKSDHSYAVDVAMDMHKLIRFATLFLGGDGYLNFMGNEFGHPEWIDFPREGNGWSYHYARRQWSLADNHDLKYEWLQCFDNEMIKFATAHQILKGKPTPVMIDQERKIIVFEKQNLIFVLNFHQSYSEPNFYISAAKIGEGKYKAVFSSDRPMFGGKDRISEEYIYSAVKTTKGIGFDAYIPCRTACIFQKVERMTLF